MRLVPLGIIVGLVYAYFEFGLNRYLRLDVLRANDLALHAFVADHPLLSAAVFITTYASVVGLSLPGGTIMTMSGGFLFGLWGGSALSVVGATVGAVIIFSIARHVIGDLMRARTGSFLARMASGFERDAFSYLLFLRLVPLFPFWTVNLVPALLGVDLRTFVMTTAMGVVPGALAYASVGDSLGLYFAAGSDVPIGQILNLNMIALRASLALMVLLPISVRWAIGRWRHR
jgi:uncharacterized membrane protein YdjX (TVP38/TMEM64 family)